MIITSGQKKAIVSFRKIILYNCFDKDKIATCAIVSFRKIILYNICRCERWQNYDVERFFKNILIPNRNNDTSTYLKDFDDFKKNNSLKNNQVIDY